MHNDFGDSAANLKGHVDVARSEILANISFISQDITDQQAPFKPVALTEWNIDVQGDKDRQKRTSIANGMQAVVLLCEMMKNNFGMAVRWLVANWEDDVFYFGSNANIPRWNPRPAFYYLYYLQRFTGDQAISTSYSGQSNDILAYATRFASGEIGVIAVNKGIYSQTVTLLPREFAAGEQNYIYSLRGNDGSQWPQGVFVNDEGPIQTAWRPLDILEDVEARAYPAGNEIKFESPGRSVQYVLIESGDSDISPGHQKSAVTEGFALLCNYPNPFNPQTVISYSLRRSASVRLSVFDLKGREIATLVHGETRASGKHRVVFFATDRNGVALPGGVYLCRLETPYFTEIRKMTLIH